jgi:hypothetical protein
MPAKACFKNPRRTGGSHPRVTNTNHSDWTLSGKVKQKRVIHCARSHGDVLSLFPAQYPVRPGLLDVTLTH